MPSKTAHRRRQAYGDRWRGALGLWVGALFCFDFSLVRPGYLYRDERPAKHEVFIT
jgi:hypothetical protein